MELEFKTQFFLCAPENEAGEEVCNDNEEEEEEEEDDGSFLFLLLEGSSPRHNRSLTLEDLLVFVLDGL